MNWRSVSDTEKEPVTLAAVLQDVMKRVAPTLADERKPERRPDPVATEAGSGLDQVQSLWQQVVGEPISEMTRVTRYRGGVLSVEVTAAPLLAELRTFARDELLRGLQQRGLEGVLEIRYQAGTGDVQR